MGFLDGTNKAPSAEITIKHSDSMEDTEEDNPDYDAWVQQDQ